MRRMVRIPNNHDLIIGRVGFNKSPNRKQLLSINYGNTLNLHCILFQPFVDRFQLTANQNLLN